jgi:hypothetical protein
MDAGLNRSATDIERKHLQEFDLLQENSNNLEYLRFSNCS